MRKTTLLVTGLAALAALILAACKPAEVSAPSDSSAAAAPAAASDAPATYIAPAPTSDVIPVAPPASSPVVVTTPAPEITTHSQPQGLPGSAYHGGGTSPNTRGDPTRQ